MAGVEGVTVTVVEEKTSAAIKGTGGGEAGTFSLELKSLMKPLFFLTTVLGGAPAAPVREDVLGSVGVLRKSAVEDAAEFLPFALPLLLEERILVQLMALCAKPGSGVRTLDEVTEPDPVAVAVALRERSRAWAWASSNVMSLMGIGFGL